MANIGFLLGLIVLLTSGSTVNGAPSVMQHVSGSEKNICYDVVGEDGTIFDFLTDPKIDLKITARLGDTGAKEVLVTVGHTKVHVNLTGVTTDKDGIISDFIWPKDYAFAAVGEGKSVTTVGLFNDRVVIKTELVQITITREPFDFTIGLIEGMSPNAGATGIIGGLKNKGHIKSSELRIENPDGRNYVIPLTFSEKKSCWEVPDKSDVFEEFLQQNTVKCMDDC